MCSYLGQRFVLTDSNFASGTNSDYCQMAIRTGGRSSECSSGSHAGWSRRMETGCSNSSGRRCLRSTQGCENGLPCPEERCSRSSSG